MQIVQEHTVGPLRALWHVYPCSLGFSDHTPVQRLQASCLSPFGPACGCSILFRTTLSLSLRTRRASMPGRTGAALFKPASCRRTNHQSRKALYKSKRPTVGADFIRDTVNCRRRNSDAKPYIKQTPKCRSGPCPRDCRNSYLLWERLSAALTQ